MPGKHQPNPEQSFCKLCAEGTQSKEAGSKSTACEACPKGTFALKEGTVLCYSCIPGRYTAGLTGLRECKKCPIGRHTNSIGYEEKECTACLAGFSQDQEGMASCLPCRPGKANQLTGKSKCLDCNRGQYAADPKLQKCAECELGKDTENKTGASACSGCDLGRHGIAHGVCVECEKGKFIDKRGSSDCKSPKSLLFTANDARTAERPIDYLVKSSCNTIEYLNATAKDPYLHRCLPCPLGASCVGHIDQRYV